MIMCAVSWFSVFDNFFTESKIDAMTSDRRQRVFQVIDILAELLSEREKLDDSNPVRRPTQATDDLSEPSDDFWINERLSRRQAPYDQTDRGMAKGP